jgi:hypothetical protein
MKQVNTITRDYAIQENDKFSPAGTDHKLTMDELVKLEKLSGTIYHIVKFKDYSDHEKQ